MVAEELDPTPGLGGTALETCGRLPDGSHAGRFLSFARVFVATAKYRTLLAVFHQRDRYRAPPDSQRLSPGQQTRPTLSNVQPTGRRHVRCFDLASMTEAV